MSIMYCEGCQRQVDTDEFPIGEDGRCEACVDADIAKFYGMPVKSLDAQGRADPNPQFFAGEKRDA